MKRMGVLCCLALVLAAGRGWSSDYDIHQMQERLAAQEARMAEQDARMNDLHAKIQNSMYMSGSGESSADSIISLQKNAKVTVGGLLTTKYTYTKASVSSLDGRPDDAVNGRGTREVSKTGNLAITDAELYLNVDVNEHFDAFVALDLQNDARDYYIAKAYYVRWKNICNTGWGLKVGRDALVFGEEGIGELGSYAAGGGDGLSEIGLGYGTIDGGIIPIHNGWDVDGVVQVTPYWEGLDGKLSFELSFMQNIYDDEAAMDWGDNNYYRINGDGVLKTRSRNFGVGSMSARVMYTAIEDLKFTFGIVNYREIGNGGYDADLDQYDDTSTGYGQDIGFSQNNKAFALAAGWRPSFLNRFYFWGQWIHGSDVYHFDGAKSDAINYGVSFDLAEGLTMFAQGDYLRTRYKWGGNDAKATACAFYTGLQYSLPYGVSLEAGWKYENVKHSRDGQTVTKARANTLYLLAGFEF